MGTAMKTLLNAVCILLLFGSIRAQPFRFDGHKVLQVSPASARELDMILALHNTYDLDMWSHPKKHNHTFEVYVKPTEIDSFLAELNRLGTNVRVWIDDIQQLIDRSHTHSRRKVMRPSLQHSSRNYFNLSIYHSYEEIQHYLHDAAYIANEQYTGFSAKVVTIGYSVEGRRIYALELSYNGTSRKHRKKIFIDGAMHAREWISPATVLCFINELTYKFNENADLLRNFDWFFVPVVNPDGYEYSRNSDRLWRKNRQVGKRGKQCMGVDLNRNFGFEWNPELGGSSNPCSNVFSGEHAFSEPESIALRDYILTNKDGILLYLTFHSYGQMWLYPWGYTKNSPTTHSELQSMARTAINTVKQKYNTAYTEGTSAQTLYVAAGGSDDWAYGTANIPYSYTPELRDLGNYAFTLPENQISETCDETWDAVKAMADELTKLYSL